MQLQGMELKALAMSRDTAKTTPPRDTASPVVRALTRMMASTVERPLRKPNWCSARSGPISARCPARRLAMTLSKSLPTSSSNTMGRYADGESAGRPGFRMRTSFPVFQRSGNWPLSKHALRSPSSRGPRACKARTQALPGKTATPYVTNIITLKKNIYIYIKDSCCPRFHSRFGLKLSHGHVVNIFNLFISDTSIHNFVRIIKDKYTTHNTITSKNIKIIYKN